MITGFRNLTEGEKPHVMALQFTLKSSLKMITEKPFSAGADSGPHFPAAVTSKPPRMQVIYYVTCLTINISPVVAVVKFYE